MSGYTAQPGDRVRITSSGKWCGKTGICEGWIRGSNGHWALLVRLDTVGGRERFATVRYVEVIETLA